MTPQPWSPTRSGTHDELTWPMSRCQARLLRAELVRVLRRSFSLMTSVWRVSMTCAAKPVVASGVGVDREPLAVLVCSTGSATRFVFAVVEADRHVLRVEDLADLVADEVEDGLEVELGREPSCTLLMIASSAARCSVSLNSRCVSSNRRAFSSATPMLRGDGAAAGALRDSPKACSRS